MESEFGRQDALLRATIANDPNLIFDLLSEGSAFDIVNRLVLVGGNGDVEDKDGRLYVQLLAMAAETVYLNNALRKGVPVRPEHPEWPGVVAYMFEYGNVYHSKIMLELVRRGVDVLGFRNAKRLFMHKVAPHRTAIQNHWWPRICLAWLSTIRFNKSVTMQIAECL